MRAESACDRLPSRVAFFDVNRKRVIYFREIKMNSNGTPAEQSDRTDVLTTVDGPRSYERSALCVRSNRHRFIDRPAVVRRLTCAHSLCLGMSHSTQLTTVRNAQPQALRTSSPQVEDFSSDVSGPTRPPQYSFTEQKPGCALDVFCLSTAISGAPFGLSSYSIVLSVFRVPRRQPKGVPAPTLCQAGEGRGRPWQAALLLEAARARRLG